MKKRRRLRGEGLIDIGDNVFINCGLQTITIPKSVDTLGVRCLTGIPEIIFKGDIPEGFLAATFLSPSNRTKKNGIWEILTIRQGTKKLLIPNTIEQAGINALRTAIEMDTLFDPKFADSIPSFFSNAEDMQDITIAFWDRFQDLDIKKGYAASLRGRAKNICVRLIRENRETFLVRFLKMDLVTQNTMKKLLDEIPEEMITARSYILSILTKTSKKNKNLLKM